MSRIKVLMADDEPDTLHVMAKKVAEAGYDVITAQDGQEALDKIRSESPDAIILDITMPTKNGLQVLQDVRENPSSEKWQPVIIVSARRELEDMKKGYELEADHYIAKPCTIDDILKALRLMISLIDRRNS